jgi:hypothetical protein
MHLLFVKHQLRNVQILAIHLHVDPIQIVKSLVRELFVNVFQVYKASLQVSQDVIQNAFYHQIVLETEPVKIQNVLIHV